MAELEYNVSHLGMHQSPALHILVQQEIGSVFISCASLQAIARPMYSNPPLHGALLVKEILGNEPLKQQ